MVARLQEVDLGALHKVDEAMLLGYASRPRARQNVLQRLGFADSGKGIADDGLDEVEHPQRNLAIGCDPELEVFPKLSMKDGETLALTGTRGLTDV